MANVAPNDPNHGVSGVSYELYSTFHPNETAVDLGIEQATMMGFVTEQATTFLSSGASGATEAVNFLTLNHIPVLSMMAENFVFFDQWFLTSGSFGDDSNFGVPPVPALPQVSIFQQLMEKNMT